MKRLVRRRDIVDYATYEDSRASSRPAAIAAKKARRVHLGDYLTFAFENSETLRYQIQEIMRVERTVREADIEDEINTYNALLGDSGDLGCVLMIEIESESERTLLLTQWRDLPEHIYVRLADDTRVYARFDTGQVGDDRLSAVQYLQFSVEGRVPVAVGTDLLGLESEVQLNPLHIAALTEDLSRT